VRSSGGGWCGVLPRRQNMEVRFGIFPHVRGRRQRGGCPAPAPEEGEEVVRLHVVVRWIRVGADGRFKSSAAGLRRAVIRAVVERLTGRQAEGGRQPILDNAGADTLLRTSPTRPEDGARTPMLLARSRHTSVRSLERYARPSVDTVGAYVARQDPAARRRHVGIREWRPGCGSRPAIQIPACQAARYWHPLSRLLSGRR